MIGQERRVLAIFVAAFALLLLASCVSDSSDSDGVSNRSLARATGLPPASQIAANDAIIPAGQWGLIRAPQTGGDPDVTFAIKATAMRHGKAGDMRDVQTQFGADDLSKAMPYYISYDYVVLTGDVQESPNLSLLATSKAAGHSSDSISTLSVPVELMRCKPRGDFNPYPPGYGYEIRGCVVAVADSSATPKYLRYDSTSPDGSKGVRFQIPTR